MDFIFNYICFVSVIPPSVNKHEIQQYAVEECIFKGMSPLKVANLRFPPLISVDFQSMENKILPCFIPKFQAPHSGILSFFMHGKNLWQTYYVKVFTNWQWTFIYWYILGGTMTLMQFSSGACFKASKLTKSEETIMLLIHRKSYNGATLIYI